MITDVALHSERRKERCWLKDCHRMMLPRAKPISYYQAEDREKKKAEVLRLVEAQIAGCVDLSPEEMVDAAFIMVEKINSRIYER